MSFRLFSVLFSAYSLLSIIGLYLNFPAIDFIGLAVATVSAYFLRLAFKGLTWRGEFRIPYAGAYLMLLGYLGAVIGVPTSLVPQVHLLGLSLALVGAMFVDVGILAALVLGVYRLSGFLRKRPLELVALLFLAGLLISFASKPVSYGIYFASSALFLKVGPKR